MATSCASPTAPSSILGDELGRDRFPLRPLLASRHPRHRALRALPHLDADAVPASAHTGHERNDVGPRASRHDVTHPSTQQRWQKGSPTGSVTPQPPTPPPQAPTLRRRTTSPATTSWRPETSSPLTTSHTMAPTASFPPRPRMGTWNGIFPACRIR
jgi:hypothetical protein